MSDASPSDTRLRLRGRLITEDSYGRICLNDLWDLAGRKPAQEPKHWRGNRAAKALIEALQKKVTAGYLLSGTLTVDVIHAPLGRGSRGTFAHPVIAAAYAGYLSPKLEIEIREVWLRFRAGDATLADDILQRASAEANHWAGTRALSRARRVSFTDTLKDHGVIERGYMECTEATYLQLLGGRSYEVRARRGWPPKSNLRAQMDAVELTYVMAAESLAAERIEEEERQGNADCAEATALSASALRAAIEADRHNRQRRLFNPAANIPPMSATATTPAPPTRP